MLAPRYHSVVSAVQAPHEGERGGEADDADAGSGEHARAGDPPGRRDEAWIREVSALMLGLKREDDDPLVWDCRVLTCVNGVPVPEHLSPRKIVRSHS